MSIKVLIRLVLLLRLYSYLIQVGSLHTGCTTLHILQKKFCIAQHKKIISTKKNANKKRKLYKQMGVQYVFPEIERKNYSGESCFRKKQLHSPTTVNPVSKEDYNYYR